MLSIANRNTIDSKRGGLTGLNKIFASYNFTNMWSSENIDISGTNTTLLDYAGEHDLVNPAAANQPTFVSSDADFNGKPSLTYNGTTDYSYKAVSDWRGSDSSGMFIGVYKIVSGVRSEFLATCDTSASSQYVILVTAANDLNLNIKGIADGVNNIFNADTPTTVLGSPAVIGFGSTGSKYKFSENSSIKTGTATTGTDNGKWIGDISLRDNISIGASVITGVLHANIEWVFSGNMPYISDSNVISVQNELKTYYGI